MKLYFINRWKEEPEVIILGFICVSYNIGICIFNFAFGLEK